MHATITSLALKVEHQQRPGISVELGVLEQLERHVPLIARDALIVTPSMLNIVRPP